MPASTFCVVTNAEVEDAIATNRRAGASQKADRLTEWSDLLLDLYAARVLPVDLAVARQIRRLSDRARRRGYAPGFADLAIAAAAQRQGWTILTRNIRHFTPFGVPAHDPFETLPADASEAC